MRHLGTRASDLVLILVWLNTFGPLSAQPQASGANAVTVGKSPIVELASPKKLLFLPFFNEAADKNFSWLENSIGSSIHDVAHKRYQYTKIDDADFSIYFINKGYSPSDLYDFKKITKIAHDLGVDGVIYGTFKPDAEKANVIVTGKILSVVDKEIIAEKTVTIPVSSEMFSGVEEVSDSLGDNIKNLFYPSDKGALIRAATLPGWGHRYKQRPGWGNFWGGLFWSSVAFTTLSTFQLIRYSISYKNYTPENYTSPNGGVGLKDPAAVDAQVASYKSSINTWGAMSLGGIIGTALIYGLNLLHAYNILPDVVQNPDITGEDKKATLRFEMRPYADARRIENQYVFCYSVYF